jgi:hypothetical protein
MIILVGFADDTTPIYDDTAGWHLPDVPLRLTGGAPPR